MIIDAIPDAEEPESGGRMMRIPRAGPYSTVNGGAFAISPLTFERDACPRIPAGLRPTSRSTVRPPPIRCVRP